MHEHICLKLTIAERRTIDVENPQDIGIALLNWWNRTIPTKVKCSYNAVFPKEEYYND